MGKAPSRRQGAIVLLSGGMDSAACLHYYRSLGFSTRAFFLDYGQSARLAEREAASNIAATYDVRLETALFDSGALFHEGEICGRNAFLLMAALMCHPGFHGLVGIGIHSGTSYYDCSNEFLQQISAIAREYSQGRVTIDAPFVNWTKWMIFNYCEREGVPIHLTYSCETGSKPPCGACGSCKERQRLAASS